MPRPPSEHPTDLELTILKVLWTSSPRTVEEVRDALAESGRELAHSSVITMMNIMVRKGYLDRTKNGRAFEFRPLIAEDEVGRGMVSDLVHRVFDGSATTLMLRLLEAGDVDPDELAEIRRLIQKATKKTE
ncbi:BlaI/MecI/CopY family transcriptional regulator [Planctomyces sp. SH-PL14]|uniref:BlaI/MecI/CopY family transcriptional regulator n=1 Tax=Planctomyces sp. SH-PL14 TaxID=1632864 RepID=UPI00078DEEA9|nr:BlaI/MecI/CopY family transcriptional regulator [Planctomyces sp. SH-PL14]AMV20709.1 Methicillin resistance regulatory protein MecI [Planctomyces sp. SH-PL14]